jgi:hypothetical protein
MIPGLRPGIVNSGGLQAGSRENPIANIRLMV